MKKLFTTAMVLAGMTMAAGTAIAQSTTYCDSYARAEMERLYPTGGGAITGGLFGAIAGAGIAGVTGGNVGAGAGIGAGAGLVVGSAAWQARRQEVFQAAFASCMGGAVQPVYAPPPPAAPPPAPPYWAVITGSGLNIRNAPGVTGTAVIGVLHPGDVFQIVGHDGSWSFIQFNAVSGWVSRSYTRQYN